MQCLKPMDSRFCWSNTHLYHPFIPAKAGIQWSMPELVEKLRFFFVAGMCKVKGQMTFYEITKELAPD